MMKSGFFIAIASALVMFVSSPTSAEMGECLANGDFEQLDGGSFTDWEHVPFEGSEVSVSSDSVISGTYSAKIGTDGAYHDIRQEAETTPTWKFEMDFAFLEGSTRSASFLLSNAGGGPINVKVDSGSLYVVDVGAWSPAVLSVPETCATSGSSWSGQTPVTNHITIEGFYDEDPYYTITLNETSSGNLDYFQGAAPVAGSVDQVMLRTGDAGDVNYWLADNVSLTLVPEPTSLILLTSFVLGLFGFAWRKRN